MIVVDASIVSFLLIEGELTEEARALYRIDSEWITPPILNHEMLAILTEVGSLEGDAAAMIELWRQVRLLVGSRQQIPDPVRSLRRGVESGISGYDAQYLALAEQLSLPLITEEEALLQAAPSRAVSLRSYLEERIGR
jgi:predicted nucleic acid-binding protein